MKKIYITPSGTYNVLYRDMLEQVHLLIGGTTGSGKSVVVNGILSTALLESPAKVRFILVDPKKVELVDYKFLPHTIAYASEPDEMVKALETAVKITDERYSEMQARRVKRYEGSDVYVVIDELADLLTTCEKAATPLLQRLCQIGRAARVHVIAATQRPTVDVVSAAITCNIDARLGLRCRNAQESRNIIYDNGCEMLPRHGQGYYYTPERMALKVIPMVDEAETRRLIDYWEQPERKYTKRRLFAA